MKTAEITQNNKLIAEFMDWRKSETVDKYYHPVTRKHIKTRDIQIDCFILSMEHPIVESMYLDVPGYEYQYIDNDPMDIQHLVFLPESLCFHVDWNWLMPVVKKIRETYSTSAHYERWFEHMRDFLIDGSIGYIYRECILFIKWYNENK